MMDVVSSANGTGGAAEVKNVKVAGKTGTAQWGPKKKERTAAWFAGFAPADAPRNTPLRRFMKVLRARMAHGGDCSRSDDRRLVARAI